jgi:hypothetical protein
LTVVKDDGEQVTYDPKPLRGVSVYKESEREFAVGDRIMFNAPDKRLQVANRDPAVIGSISPAGASSPGSMADIKSNSAPRSIDTLITVTPLPATVLKDSPRNAS